MIVDIRLRISRRCKSWSVDGGRLESFLVNLVIYVTFFSLRAGFGSPIQNRYDSDAQINQLLYVMNHFPLDFSSVSLA